MKRIISILILSISLAGCASLGDTISNLQTAVQLGNVSVANPVTPDRLAQMENAAIVVFAGLKTWKRACVQGAIPATCRAQIRAVQVYTRQIPPYLAQLRRFVRTNDQVNAGVIWTNVMQIITTVRTQAAANGVPIGS